jgi:selenocysteine lyase/cysteine desulfurase
MNLDRRSFLSGLGVSALGALVGCTTTSEARGAVPALPVYGRVDDESFWRAVRAQFPLRADPVYLNTGGLGPVSQPVLDRVWATMSRLQEHAEHGHDEFAGAREAMAGFLGATPDELCFARNATEGNSIIAAGLALAPGDEVIFESHAHPGGSFPWANQAKLRGIKVLLFEPDHESPEGNVARIRELISPQTKVIQVSHITCTTGLVFPVAAIAALAREHNLWFHIDGAQSVGMIPVDLHATGCDSYAFSGHKWLGGPHETGMLYIRRDRLEAVASTGIGAHSGELSDLTGPIELFAAASRHEYGTRSAAQIHGLVEAMRLQERIGVQRIATRGRELAGGLLTELGKVDGLTVLTPAHAELRASMTAIRHPRATGGELFGYLWQKHGLRCRPVSEQGLQAVRISTHIFNSPAECERVVAAVRASLRDL